MRRCLRKLEPNDTFQMIRFSDIASGLGPAPIPATPENIERGLSYLESLTSEGGTMALEGIKAALDFPHDPSRTRIVSFMTDGYIGNEEEILAAVKEKVGSARIFSFGVGTSVNRYLLEGMARLGHGAVAYVGLNEDDGGEAELFYERASRPALTDIRVDWGNLKVSDVFPQELPALFAGRPATLIGRFQGQQPTTIRVSGLVGGVERTFTIDVDPTVPENQHPAIESLWARWQIEDLSDEEASNPSEQLRREITDISLKHHLLCRYTAFVAVDESERTTGPEGVEVAVPVPVPKGVRYETTVQE
jgi:Ca-activated chloride channel family protein